VLVQASAILTGVVSPMTFAAGLQDSLASVSANITVSITLFKQSAQVTQSLPGTVAQYQNQSVQLQFKMGVAATADILPSQVNIHSILPSSSDRRRLQSGVDIGFDIETSDPSAATNIASVLTNTTVFKDNLVANINAAGSSLTLNAQQIAAPSAPLFITEVKYTVQVPSGSLTGNASASAVGDSVVASVSNPEQITDLANSARVVGTPIIPLATVDARTVEAINCAGFWGEYGSCSATCGAASRSRTYTVTTQAENSGALCVAGDGSEITNGQVQSQICSDLPPCPLSGQITTSLTLDLDLSTIPEGSAARATFEANFRIDMATILNIPIVDRDSRIRIDGYTAASTVVEFTILPEVGTGNNIQPSTLAAAFASAGQSVAGYFTTSTLSLVDLIVIGGASPPLETTTTPNDTSSTNNTMIVVAAVIAVAVVGGFGLVGLKKRKTAQVVGTRPAMMSPAAAAYVTEATVDSSGEESLTAARSKRGRKLSF